MLRAVLRQVGHNLTAWNTCGEGVHSPYLFNLVRFVLRGPESFYAWSELRPNRQEKIFFRLLNQLHQEGIVRVDVCDERTVAVVRAVAKDIRVDISKGTPAYIHMTNPNKDICLLPADAELPARWTTVFDYGELRLVFFDPQYLKRTYRLAL